MGGFLIRGEWLFRFLVYFVRFLFKVFVFNFGYNRRLFKKTGCRRSREGKVIVGFLR